MRRVMIATPAYDGRVEVEYVFSLTETIRLCAERDIRAFPVWWPGEALVQHARNMLVGMAIESGVHDILFVDADQDWHPAFALSMLQHPVECVGAAVRKKSDAEAYNVRAASPNIPVDPKTGLMVVEGLGTGFLRLSRAALDALWRNSIPYRKNDQASRMVFDIGISQDGQLVGEDTSMCFKLAACGIPVHLDPSCVPGHIGKKKYSGDFQAYLAKLKGAV